MNERPPEILSADGMDVAIQWNSDLFHCAELAFGSRRRLNLLRHEALADLSRARRGQSAAGN